MNKLQRLILSFTLTSVLAVAAFAGETLTPPCAPGETQTPPCSNAAQTATDGSVAPGQTDTPPASDVDVIGIAEIALRSLLLF